MPGRFATIRRSSLVAGFSRLAAGTLVGQALLLAFAPLLTRLYSPAEYGVNALFTAAVSTLSIVALMRLDVPLALTEVRSVRRQIGCIVALSSLAFGLLLLLVVLIFGQLIARSMKTEESSWLLVIPLGVILFAINKIALQNCLSLQRYGFVSAAGAIRILCQCLAQVAFGIAGWGGLGLIVGLVISYAVSTAIIALYLNKAQEGMKWVFSGADLRRTWSNVVEYPRIALPAELLSMGSLTIIAPAIALVYGPGAAGHYALANTFLGIPLNLIGNNLRQVYLREGSLELSTKGSLRGSFDASARMLLAASLPLAAAVWFFAPPFFGFAFGSEWRTSGGFAQLLVGFFIARLIVTPLAATVNIVDRQGVGLVSNSVILVLVVGIFVLAELWRLPVEVSLLFLSIGYVLAYGVLFVVLRRLSRTSNRGSAKP